MPNGLAARRAFCSATVMTLSLRNSSRRTLAWVNQTNTLTDWPTYQFMLQAYGRKSRTGGTALMIGSLTAMSSRSFVRLAEEEYGMGMTCVIDLFATKPKAKHGNFFARANGLNLPFASGSIDVIHTNRLIRMLENPSSAADTPRAMIPKLAQEIVRVLAPRGQLFMYETTPDFDTNWTAQEAIVHTMSVGNFVVDQLQRAGMASAHVILGSPPTKVDSLFDPERNFDHSRRVVEVNESAFGVYGSKGDMLNWLEIRDSN